MRTMHGIFDVNNDGVISFEDFEELAKNFGALGNLSPQEVEDFRAVMKVGWTNFWVNIHTYDFNLLLVDMGD